MKTRKIPFLAVAAMAMTTGCGDEAGGSGSGGTDISDGRANSIWDDYCAKWAECDPEGFDYEASYYDWSNADECGDFYAEYYSADALAEYGYSDTCLDAMFDYYECLGGLSCDDFDADEYTETACDDLYATAADACDFNAKRSAALPKRIGKVRAMSLAR